MPDNEQSKIRYDDFVGVVQSDPTKPEAAIMLSGFIGHGADGEVRIYTDPSLGTWYDVPEADVIHSLPVADAQLGGSYVWLRASAAIKPGAATPPPPPAQAAAAAVLPTTTVMPTPATHCFICTLPNQCIQPTPTAHVTLATVCTQFCPTHPQTGCNPLITNPAICVPTQPVICGVLPPSIGCQVQGGGAAAPQAFAAQAAVHPTPTAIPTYAVCTLAGCQQQTLVCPPHNTGPTICTETLPPHTHAHNTLCICPTPTAVHTAATLCTQLAVCAQAGGAAQPFAAGAMVHQNIHPTATAQHTVAGCVHPTHTVQHTVLGCIHPTTTVMHTVATLCTQAHAGCIQPTTTVQQTSPVLCAVQNTVQACRTGVFNPFTGQ